MAGPTTTLPQVTPTTQQQYHHHQHDGGATSGSGSIVGEDKAKHHPHPHRSGSPHHGHHHGLAHGLHLGQPALAHDCRHAMDILHGLLDTGPDAARAHADLQTATVRGPRAPANGETLEGPARVLSERALRAVLQCGARPQAVFVLTVSKVGFLLAVKSSTGIGVARLPDGSTCRARSAGRWCAACRG